jgi:glycerol-3-phosphate acyltransferase PlsY
LGLSFLSGSIPFSGLGALLAADVDLRAHGSGTVSGTGLYEVAGFGPLALAGSLDVAKGAIGPLLAGAERPWLGSGAAACSIAGHNWSPWLGGAGGRGLSPAIGALGVLGPEGSVVLLGGMAFGRLVKQTALGSLVALVALFPVLAIRRGWRGLCAAGCVTGPIVAKRLAGNRRTADGHRGSTLVARLFFDRDAI